MTEQPKQRNWTEPSAEKQSAVRVEYGRHLDTLPPTCSMETGIERFRSWLRKHEGIGYQG
jgi:transposase